MEYQVKFVKKTIFILFILLAQFALLYAYYKQENFITSFKLDYLSKVYLPMAQYKISKSSFWTYPGKNTQLYTQEARAAESNEKAIPVLLYHGIVERLDGSNILVDDFRNQLMALKKAGYQTVTLDDFYQFVQGKRELPDKSFLLTFDDGRKDSYYPSDPILKALGYNAIMFVITRYINTENDHFYLSKDELQAMIDSKRWELEAHTKDGHDMIPIGSNYRAGHYYTNKIWDPDKGLETEREFEERVFNDFLGARNDIENNFGTKPYAFAFPFGDFGLGSVNYPESKDFILKMTGYVYPISFYQGTLGNGFIYNYFGDNEYLFKRIDVRPEWAPNDLLGVLKSGEPKELPFSDNFSDFLGWFTSSGIVAMDNSTLDLKPDQDSTSGTVILEGSRPWNNYSLQASLDWKDGKRLSVFSRYRQNENYLSCEISDQYLQLTSEYSGQNDLLSESFIDKPLAKNDLEITMSVNGNNVVCSLNNGTRVSFAGIRNEQLSGGIGFRISDSAMGKGDLIIKKVSVSNVNNVTDARKSFFGPLGTNNFLFYNLKNKHNSLVNERETLASTNPGL